MPEVTIPVRPNLKALLQEILGKDYIETHDGWVSGAALKDLQRLVHALQYHFAGD